MCHCFVWQDSTSVSVSLGSVSRRHVVAWHSALILAFPTVASPWVPPRTQIQTARLWCHQNVPWGCGAEGVWANRRGEVPACPAAPTQCWLLQTRNTRTSQTATMVGKRLCLCFLEFPYSSFRFCFFVFICFFLQIIYLCKRIRTTPQWFKILSLGCVIVFLKRQPEMYIFWLKNVVQLWFSGIFLTSAQIQG